MKKTIIAGITIFAAALLIPQITQAQGTVTFLSNLGQTPTGSSPVGSDSWVAENFFTGSNPGGYVLNSIQLAMTDASGNPSGFTVMLYGASFGGAVLPGSSLGTLTGSTDPSTAGVYTFTAPSDFTLPPGTPYFIVITSSTQVANGAYGWSYTGADSYNPVDRWLCQGGVLTSSDGSSWDQFTPVAAQFAINATAAPEPGVIGFFALGGLLLGFRRWKAKPV